VLKQLIFTALLLISTLSADEVNQSLYVIPVSIASNLTQLNTDSKLLKSQIAALEVQQNTFKTQINVLDDLVSRYVIKIELILVASVLFIAIGIGLNIILLQGKVKEFFDLMKIRYDTRPMAQQLKEDLPQIEVKEAGKLEKPKIPKKEKIEKVKESADAIVSQ
jgi:hypothetical protein